MREDLIKTEGEKKMKLLKLTNLVLFVALAFALIGCGSKENPPANTEPPKADDLIQNLEFNEDGSFNVDYLENVQLNVWSVIGNPDKTAWINLINEFNIQYSGIIQINLISQPHESYYNSLDNTYVNNYADFPDMCIMHNEKNVEYASKGYFYALDELIEATKIDYSFDNAYENIIRTTIYNGKHYGVPIDAHGYLTNIRQDIIKKNELGFENNTRFIPQNYTEYQTLLEGLKEKADDGSLWVRNIATEQDHSWYKISEGNPNLKDDVVVTQENFAPAFFFLPESEILTSLYVNGGTLLDENGSVNFHNNTAFVKFLTDMIDRKNAGLYGDPGTKDFVFPFGKTVMFPEGPWWVANSYDGLWNNKQLKEAGKLGVTEEDANDPIYSEPYTVSRARWFAQEGAPAELANKWYGNGHVITLTNKIKDMQKVAGALVFAQWLTQGKARDGVYNLAKWSAAGHLPAWRNVYESEGYKNIAKDSMTLKALGDPADIIALESTEFATLLTTGIVGASGDVHAALLDVNGCTHEQARQILLEKANLTQETIDMILSS